MSMADELNRIGHDMAKRRLHAAEAVARQALAMRPHTNETAEEFASRLRFYAERHHPELVVRFQHTRIEVLPRAEDCGCNPESPGYGDDHCQSDEGSEYLCARQHLGWICGDCDNEACDGPSWSPRRHEWPCPAVRLLDAPKQVAANIRYLGGAK
jgi:hypothetical protein